MTTTPSQAPTPGEWIEVIHNCPTPDERQIIDAQAQVGSIWQCKNETPQCNDRWKLRQIRNEPGVRGGVGKFPKWDRLTVNGTEVSERG